MKRRTRVLAVALALVSLPVLVALADAVSFHSRNRSNGSLISSGESREYLLYVPKSYDPGEPTPLVISMHGGAMWPAAQRDLSGWNRLAESQGLIVVYPAGLRLGGTGPSAWRLMRDGSDLTRDVRFISDLIDVLATDYSIDLTRIYADGLSNGGGMAYVLSCALSDRVAAVGMVAAAQMLPASWCQEGRPFPMIAFHGTADAIVPYEGGTTWVWNGSFPDVSEWVSDWARRNLCAPDITESRVADDVTRHDYINCPEDAPVTLYTIHGGGHTWPGGGPVPEWFLGPTSHSIDATATMWAFFREQRLSE